MTEFERIIIAMEVNGDDMTTQQFKTYLSSDGANRRNFMVWMRERIQSRKMREGTRKGHLTTYKALQRFGKFKTFDDVPLPHIYEFDMFIREEPTYTSIELSDIICPLDKVGCISEIKIKHVSFYISLDLHYLCHVVRDTSNHMRVK